MDSLKGQCFSALKEFFQICPELFSDDMTLFEDLLTEMKSGTSSVLIQAQG